jgi:DNA topoisomerase-1
LIVESPTKARTLKRYLGDDVEILASMGHVKDLPPREIGVDVEAGFEPTYELIKEKSKVLREIKSASKKAGRIFLASDPDREGEAIAYHIATELKKTSKAEVKRVLFYEITRDEVRKALKEPQDIDLNKVYAQQARRVLDRLVGYKVSPLLWRTVRKGLSAGRVQTVALRLICTREKEIEAFVPKTFWVLSVVLEKNGVQFKATLRARGKEDLRRVEDGDLAKRIFEAIKKGPLTVKSYTVGQRTTNPPPPFKTSTLQQEASVRFNFSPKRTMRIAQELYEGVDLPDGRRRGLITYMRTDSLRLSDKALFAMRKYVKDTFPETYLPSHPRRYRDKGKTVQGAHEAIRPTTAKLAPSELEDALKKDLFKLYSAIWRRAVASQMAEARYEIPKAKITCGDLTLEAEGRKLMFDGFFKVLGDPPKDIPMPELEVGEELKIVDVVLDERQTEPPPRYSEATLVKTLEEKGIGRPSTYAPTIATLGDRGYSEKLGRFLKPTELGCLVNDILIPRFVELFDVGFTARMEEELDEVEGGQKGWQALLTEFYKSFEKELKAVENDIPKIKKSLVEETEEVCPECDRPLVVRWGRFGKFLSCSGYPKCRYARPLTEPEPTGVKCPDCGKGDIIQKRNRKGQIFYACSNYPECTYTLSGRPVPEPCEKCGHPFVVQSKYGKGKKTYCPACTPKSPKSSKGKSKSKSKK